MKLKFLTTRLKQIKLNMIQVEKQLKALSKSFKEDNVKNVAKNESNFNII